MSRGTADAPSRCGGRAIEGRISFRVPLHAAADPEPELPLNARTRLAPAPTRAAALAVALLVPACSPAPSDDVRAGATDAATEADTLRCPEIRHARHFSVECGDGFLVVRTFGEVAAWRTGRDAELVQDVVVLVPRGAGLPAGAPTDAHVVEVPAATYAVNNDDLLGLSVALGVADRLVAVGGESVFDDGVRARVDSGELGKVGYSWHLPPDLEVLLTRSPDVTFLAMDSPHNVDALGRSRELGLTIAPAFVWAERDVLARAEWLKFFGLFLGRSEEAATHFDRAEARYRETQARVATVVDSPTVLWGYHAGDDRWYFMENNLEARLLRDAGAHNPFAAIDDGPVREDGAAIASERLLIEGSDADQWVIGDIHQAALPSDEFMASFRAWREDRLYHTYARSNWEVDAYDWYEGATAHPDVLLADLAHLLHPGLLPDHEPVYFGRFDRRRGR